MDEREPQLELAAGHGVARVMKLPLPTSDAELVEGIRGADPEAATVLFDRYGAYVRNVLLHILGPDSEREDLVQEVFIAAIDSIDSLRTPSAVRNWLGSIAAVTARSWIRKRARRRWLSFMAPEELPDVEAPAPILELDEAVRATYRVLERMPADERVTFALRFVSGLELAQIAEVSRVSLSTVKRRLPRAEARFRRLALAEPSLASWLSRGES